MTEWTRRARNIVLPHGLEQVSVQAPTSRNPETRTLLLHAKGVGSLDKLVCRCPVELVSSDIGALDYDSLKSISKQARAIAHLDSLEREDCIDELETISLGIGMAYSHFSAFPPKREKPPLACLGRSATIVILAKVETNCAAFSAFCCRT